MLKSEQDFSGLKKEMCMCTYIHVTKQRGIHVEVESLYYHFKS